MATSYPTSLDSSTEQPSPSSTTDLAAAGFEHDTVHGNHSGALIAVETKLGIGASNAASATAGHVLTHSSGGATAWAATGDDTTKLPLAGGTLTGAVDMGTDGSGVDVTFHSATAGDNMLWDASAEKLVITGTDGQTALEVADGDVSITDALTVTGTTTTYLAFNNQTASYTLVLADAGKAVEVNNASANTLTVPPNSSVAFPTGTQIIVFQQGAGATTITAGAGVTLRSKDSNLAVDGQYASVALVKRASDEWYVTGALA